jgi:hypothetical protein
METKKELIERINTLHLQNNTNMFDSDASFRYGVECAIEELIELKKLRVADVSGCGHHFEKLELSEDGLFCYSCCKWVRPDAHIH